jgi:hypothetical protein
LRCPFAIVPPPVSRSTPILNQDDRSPSSERTSEPDIVVEPDGPDSLAVATRLEPLRSLTTKSRIELGAFPPSARLSAAADQTQSRPALKQSSSASEGPQL